MVNTGNRRGNETAGYNWVKKVTEQKRTTEKLNLLNYSKTPVTDHGVDHGEDQQREKRDFRVMEEGRLKRLDMTKCLIE